MPAHVLEQGRECAGLSMVQWKGERGNAEFAAARLGDTDGVLSHECGRPSTGLGSWKEENARSGGME